MVDTYKKDGLEFIIYPKSVVFMTKHQSVRITYDTYNSKRTIERLKSDILDGRVCSIQELARYNKRGTLRWSATCVDRAAISYSK